MLLVMNFKGRQKNTFKSKCKGFGPLAFVLQGSAIHMFLVLYHVAFELFLVNASVVFFS